MRVKKRVRESWTCRHTCPPERVLELSYRSSMCEVKAWKSGMTNFFRKAWVSRTMLLWTHLMNRPQTTWQKILWLHVDEGESLPTKRATQKSDKLQWSDWWSFILVWCIMWSWDKNKQVQGFSHTRNIYDLLFPEQEQSTSLINRRSTHSSWLLLSLWRQEEQDVLELQHLATFGRLRYYRHPVILSALPPS